jgi:hypothetical protein
MAVRGFPLGGIALGYPIPLATSARWSSCGNAGQVTLRRALFSPEETKELQDAG